MKKLMTMLAAAAMAFGLYADEPVDPDPGFVAGTAFDADDGGNSYLSGDFVQGYWTVPEGETVVGPATHSDVQKSNRPAKFNDTDNVNVLKIKTTLGTPVVHNVKNTGAGYDIPADGLYFDGLVNMTVFDEDPDLSLYDDDDNPVKIAVYAQEATNNVGVVTGTNFVVVAKETAAVPDGRFICSLGAKKFTEGWHRLTIKAIGNITTDTENQVQGFVVFVDRTAVECTAAKITAMDLNPKAAAWNENGNLFVSLVDDDATVKSISFDGQGSVDELVFTTTAPTFAKDSEFVVADWSAVKDNTAFGTFTLTVDGKAHEITDAESTAGKVNVAYEKDATKPVLVLSWSGDATHMGGVATLDADGNAKIAAGTEPTLAAATVKIGTADAKKYAALTGDDSAVAEVNGATADAKLTLLDEDAKADIVIDNSSTVVITIDLNGKTLTAANTTAISVTAGNVVIDGNGKVAVTDARSQTAVDSGTAIVTILSGTYDGAVFAEVATDSTAKFDVVNNSLDETCALTAPAGKKWKKVDGNAYWQLDDLATVAFSVQPATNTKATSIKIAGADASAATEITEGQSYEVIFTADEGYEFEGGDATETVTGTAATTDVTVAPTKNVVAKKIAVTGVTLDQDTLTLKVGDADVKLIATVAPDNATDKSVNWTSSADAVATVADDGTVHAVAAGEAIITVTTTDGGKTATCTVTVSAAVQPVVPGKDIKTDKTPDDINKDPELKAKLLKAPDGATVDPAVYNAYFDAVEGSAAGTVKFELNDNGKKTVADSIAEQINPAEGEPALDPAKIADGTQESMTVANPIAGFYYAIKQDAALNSMKVTECELATGADGVAITFELTKGEESGFYEILCGPTAFEVEKK